MADNLFGPEVRGAAIREAAPAKTAADTWYKNCVGGDPLTGTGLDSGFFNNLLANWRVMLRATGVDLTLVDDDIWAKCMRLGLGYRTAGGTANALTISLAPAPATLADLVGVKITIKTGAAANTAAMTLAVNGLAATPVRTPDGIDLLGGALPANTILEVVYNGTFFQVLSVLPAAAQKTPAAFTAVTNVIQSIPAGTLVTVTNFNPVTNDLVDSVLAVNQITIGPKDAGWWVIVGKLFYDFPASTMETNIIIERNGVEITAGNANGSTSIRARPNATAVYKLVAGDVIRVRTTSTVTRNLEITGGSSVFSGFKVGA